MDYKDVLTRTAGRIFEEAAFALVDPPEEEVGAGADLMAVQVAFMGPFSGTTAMASDVKLAPVMAANMLGVDEDDPAVQGKGLDAMKELLNMICGNMLPAVAGTRAEFKIDAPTEMDPAAFIQSYYAKDDPQCTTARLCVEGCDTLLVFRRQDD